MLGEVIQKFSTNFETLNFDHLSKGVYYLKFETSDGNVSEKILIN